MMEQILRNMKNPSTSPVILKFAVFVAYLFCVNRMKNKVFSFYNAVNLSIIKFYFILCHC